MNFKQQILSRTGTPESASTDLEITYYLNSTIKDVINKVKAVNPDAYSRMAIQTEVGAEGETIIDGDIIGVYGTPVHTGAAVTGINITNSGSGYTDSNGALSANITITISGGGGTGATAYAIVNNSGLISSITLTNGGAGYTSVPTVTITTTDNGVNGTATAVLAANATYRRPAQEVSFDLSEQAKNPNSIHYQSKFNPVWVRKGRSISVIPEGGIVMHIDIPTTSYDSETIGSVPKPFENAVVIGSAIKHTERYLQHFTQNEIPLYLETSIPNVPTFSESMPASLTAPTFAWNPTVLQSRFDGQSIDTTYIRSNFPSYVAPELEIPTLDPIADLVLPDPPAAPGFITKTLNMSEIPTFNAPAIQIEAFPSIPDYTATAELPAPPLAPSLAKIDVSETSLEELPGPPVYVPPKLLGQAKTMLEDTIGATVEPNEGDLQDVNTLLEAAWSYVVELEDVELANATLSVIQNIQQLYNVAMSEADKHYQQQVTEYQALVTRQLEKSRLEQTSEHKQNDMDWQYEMSQYDKALAHHQAEMSHYQAEVQTKHSEWTLENITWKLAKWNQKQDKYFAEFDKGMTLAMNTFTNDMNRWEKEFQQKTQELTIEDKAQSDLLATYDKEMTKWNADVKAAADQYQQNELLKKWEKYKFEYTQSLSKFSAEISSNMNIYNEQNQKLSTEVQLATTNASNIQSALSAQMSADTELAKNNEMQRLAQELQTFQQEIAVFNLEMQKYTTEVSNEVSKYNAQMTEATNTMTNNQNKFNSDMQTFQNKQQALEKLLASLRQEYAESVGVMVQQKGES